MFPAAAKEDLKRLGWSGLDVILVTGDAYIDSPFIGAAVIANTLLDAGYRVGVIAQPDTGGGEDIMRLGEPELFWGVTSGCMDSMAANYTASKKKRRRDDLTAGGVNIRRPDRALIVYCGLIRRYFKNTRPVVIGGLEAGMRRISHYDYMQDKVRRSILFDARADMLVYGMGEKTVLNIAEALSRNYSVTDIPGLCIIGPKPGPEYIELPGHETVSRDKNAFREMFSTFYENTDWRTAKGLYQKQDTRYLIQNPPQPPLSPEALDHLHELDYELDTHPIHLGDGTVPGVETFRFAVATHRGCFGQCHFCSITAHQGRTVISRSPESILREIGRLSRHPKFKGIISDVGGASANMYGMYCRLDAKGRPCKRRRCLLPEICPNLAVSHKPQIELLRAIRKIAAIRKVFIGSGVRHDLVMADRKFGDRYLDEIVRSHVSGQLKVAPEHCSGPVLDLMGKPKIDVFNEFKEKYDRLNREAGKKQYLTCYFMAAYPGCTMDHMAEARRFARKTLRFAPEQVQIFTPTPSTPATLMYYTETSFPDGEAIHVEKNNRVREAQKRMLTESGRSSGRHSGRPI